MRSQCGWRNRYGTFGVPAIWLHASNKPAGDGFKFRDYFSSVGRPDLEPIFVDDTTDRAELKAGFHDYCINVDLHVLWAACPIRPVSPA